jgi:hypothetical protein
MGLDVVAYEGIGQFLGDNRIYDKDDSVYLMIHVPTMARAPEIRHNGYYRRLGKEFGFRAGSYSGYNSWRRWLCERFLGVDPKEVWEDPKRFEGKPFYELIDFSDCDGILGTEVCLKLCDDFHNAVFKEEEDEYQLEIFNKFMEAFGIVSSLRRGVVVFC